ncbi:chemotaxis protein CheW [Marivibrio halodurans]|uniref:Chemotaxis protein CheW n=1 Tax=Marivibrio halodurans TaxID=2039722 RepID=A0A8J7V1J7_9PROT|nr:chemotaxis protein CheW [Marivibrio halodurans]MBP5856181.1 chemotaxis protein CheW [Marivibrio halodurans]
MANIVVFQSGTRRYALDVAGVEQAMPAFEIRPLPDGPPFVLGLATIGGTILPVINPEWFFDDQPASSIGPDQRFLRVRAEGREMILLADSLEGVVDLPQSALREREALAGGMARLSGVAAQSGDLVYIVDPAKMLFAEERAALDSAMEGTPS